MSPSDFLKITIGDAHVLPSEDTCSRRSSSINFRSFATTNGNKCTGNFRASVYNGLTFSSDLKLAL